MVVFETVDLVLGVHGEGHSVKALVTDDTAETARVVGLPEGLQDLSTEEWLTNIWTSRLELMNQRIPHNLSRQSYQNSHCSE